MRGNAIYCLMIVAAWLAMASHSGIAAGAEKSQPTVAIPSISPATAEVKEWKREAGGMWRGAAMSPATAEVKEWKREAGGMWRGAAMSPATAEVKEWKREAGGMWHGAAMSQPPRR